MHTSEIKITHNTLFFYHADCPDGFGAAWAAFNFLKNEAQYIPISHSVKWFLNLKNKKIYFADIFLDNEADLSLLTANNNEVIAIDHHISTQKIIKKLPKYLFDLNNSGAVLTWQFFNSNKNVPKLLKYIEAQDLWRYDLMPNSKKVMAVVNLAAREFKTWTNLNNRLENANKIKSIIKDGTIILEAKDSYIEQIYKRQKLDGIFLGYKTSIINAAFFESDLGDYAIKKGAKLALIWRNIEGGTKVSLRGSSIINVAKLAEKFGGGGHKGASGFFIKTGNKLPWEYSK
mgnify:FL=1